MESLWLGSWFRFVFRQRLAPFVPMPPHVVSTLLRTAKVQPGEEVHDIGCGDGRLLIAAAENHRATGVGYELNPELVKTARAAVLAKGLQELIRISEVDAKQQDLSTADVISMYLSVRGNTEMLPSIIAAAAAGRSHRAGPLRVVTFSFEIPGHAPISKAIVDGIPIYLYAFPRAT